MKVLAIDTSNKPLGVAVLKDNKLLAQIVTNISKTHSETLMPTIKQVLKYCKLDVSSIDRFVVAKGPGSYTGLRIGVTTAKVFAQTLKKELVGVSSLEVIAYGVRTNKLLVPFFDARRGNVFAGVYRWNEDILETVISDKHQSFENLKEDLKNLNEPYVFLGEEVLFEEMKNHFEVTYPSPYNLGVLGQKKDSINVDELVPSYLRLTQAENDWRVKNKNLLKEQRDYVEKFSDNFILGEEGNLKDSGK